MAAAPGALTGPGITSPDLTYRPPSDQQTDESAQASSQLTTPTTTHAIQVVNPLETPSTHEDYNLGALPTGLITRICLWLSKLDMYILAAASGRCCLGVMGLDVAELLLTPDHLYSLIGEVPELTRPQGYHLVGRVNRICAFGIGIIEDFLNKLRLMPEVPEEKRERFARVAAGIREKLPRALVHCESLQRANLARLFNLITCGEQDVSFSSTSLTVEQKQKIKKIHEGYRRLNDLFISIAFFMDTSFSPRMRGLRRNSLELKSTFSGIIKSLKEEGRLQVENPEIEKFLVSFLPIFLGKPQTAQQASEAEAHTYLFTEAIRFALATFQPEQITQLAEVLQETSDLVNPLYVIMSNEGIERIKVETEADLKREVNALAPPGQLIQPPRPVARPQGGLSRSIILGINAIGIASLALNHFSAYIHPALQIPTQMGLTLFTYAALNDLTLGFRAARRVNPPMGIFAPVLGLVISALTITGLSRYTDPYFTAYISDVCTEFPILNRMRSVTGEMRILEDSITFLAFLFWAALYTENI